MAEKTLLENCSPHQPACLCSYGPPVFIDVPPLPFTPPLFQPVQKGKHGRIQSGLKMEKFVLMNGLIISDISDMYVNVTCIKS